MPSNIANLKSSLSVQSGIITRQANRFDKKKDLPPTPTSLAQIEDFLKKASAALDKVSDLVQELCVVDAARADDYTAKLDNDTARFDELSQAIGDLLASAMASPAPPVAAPPAPVQQQQTFKVIDALRPDKLSLDFTPSELYLWVTAFKSYFSASRLERLPPSDQHAFVYACMDGALQKRILPLVADDTPVFADDGQASLMKFVDDLFLQRYPLMQRRLDFFQHQHSSGQLVSAWIADLRMKADIADLDDLSTDQLMAFRIITGVRDETLQTELFKLRSPSLKDVESEVLIYEASQATKAKTMVNKVQANSGDQRPTGSGTRPRPGGLCFRCNKSGHFRRNCSYPPTVTCHKCKQVGHVATACRARVNANVVEGTNDGGAEVSEHATNAVFVRTLNVSSDMSTPKLDLRFCQGEKEFRFLALPDTGATHTIVAKDIVDRYGLVLHPASVGIFAADGSRMDCAGSMELIAILGARKIIVKALVTGSMSNQILLSWRDLKNMGVLHPDFPAPREDFMNHVRTVGVLPSSVNKIFEDYKDVLSDNLGTRCLTGPPMTVHLRTDVPIKPFKIFTTRQVPLHLRDEADRVIQAALDEGVIMREDGPTEWCCRGGFVPKPNGKLRLITDFIPLNKYVDRPVHPFPSSLDIIQAIKPTSKVFAVLDCTMGYHQVPLDEKSSKLTTFLLPQGRFRYCRAPMGLSASSDEFCRRSDDVLRGLDGVSKLVDDILIQAPDVETLFLRIRAMLDQCRLHGLTLSKRKAQFSLTKEDHPVKFAGYLISGNGVEPDPGKVAAIKQFKAPTSVSELRSFLGLVNQLGFFVPDLAHLSVKMRLLLKKGVAFLWTDEIKEDFEKIKLLLTSNLVVFPFDPALKTTLLTDASRIGLGFVLLQYDVGGRPRLIHCGSRSLLPAESRYAIVELECLAVTYAMMKCDFYLRGLSGFNLVTDHRPLVGLFDKSIQDVTNPRIQRFRERIAPFNFTVQWIAGKQNFIADALSRAPHFGSEDDVPDTSMVASVAVEDIRLKELLDAKDDNYKQILDILLQEKPLKSLPTNHPARPFCNVWDRLSVQDGLIVLDGQRIVPPLSLRSRLLASLHLSHAGVVRCRKLAQQLYYWPGINNDIKNMIDGCSACQTLRPSQQVEPQIHTVADYPMEEVSVDPYEYQGKHYLMMVDRYSGYIWVRQFRDQTTRTILAILLDWFHDFGFPGVIRSDGGPQFRSEFNEFCSRYSIRHDLSSPLYPNANGHAEANVKSSKYLLIKCLASNQDFRAGLLEMRNTPRADGYSPAQLFFGRRQRTSLPCLDSHLRPEDTTVGHIHREARDARHRARVDLRARSLPILSVGQRVIMQDVRTKRWMERGVVTHCLGTGRSYYLQLDNGKTLWRNRRYLRPLYVTRPASVEKDGLDVPDSHMLRPRKRVNYNDKRSYRKVRKD